VRDELGAFDERLDLAASIVDMSLRAHRAGIPILQAPGAQYVVAASAQEQFGPRADALVSAWLLALKWQQQALGTTLAERVEEIGGRLSPQPAAEETVGDASSVLEAWWQSRDSGLTAAARRDS